MKFHLNDCPNIYELSVRLPSALTVPLCYLHKLHFKDPCALLFFLDVFIFFNLIILVKQHFCFPVITLTLNVAAQHGSDY